MMIGFDQDPCKRACQPTVRWESDPSGRQLRDRLAWSFLAIFLSSGPVLVFCHGVFGTGPGFTAALLAFVTLGLILVGQWRLHNSYADWLFGGFVACVVVSTAKNGLTTAPKDFGICGLSLAAYLAGRVFCVHGVKTVFIQLQLALIAIGAVATSFLLVQQWDDPHGKPVFFGQFDIVPVQLATSLAFLMFAAPMRRWLSLFYFCALVVFAASIVRFVFVALAMTLVAAALLARGKYFLRMTLIVIAAFVVGNAVRFTKAVEFFNYGIEAVSPRARAAQNPVELREPCLQVNGDNSVAIRRRLLADAVSAIPRSGLFGSGLDSFAHRACLAGFQVHNSILQAFLEFGWLGGASLLLSIMLAWGLAGRAAQNSPTAMLTWCGLTFSILLSMGYGSLSHDAVLFFFIGNSVGLAGPALEVASSSDA